jgi:cyclase
VRDILQAGAEKVVINSAALRDPRCIEALAGEFGSQSIVVSIDVRKRLFGAYDVFGMGGTKRFAADPVEHAIRVCRHGAGEILLTAIDRDGTMQGYDLELIRQFSAAVSIPVVAAGGAGGLEDCLRAVENGASAVAAGSLFVYYGLRKGVLINYPEKEELRKLFGRAVRHPA